MYAMPRGISPDVTDAIAKQLGAQVQWRVFPDRPTMIAALMHGDIDMATGATGADSGAQLTLSHAYLPIRHIYVEPLIKHKAGVIALSDAGAHLVYLCDAGFGLYFLGHWVRERGAFDLPEGVRRLTSHQASLYGIPDRGRIAIGQAGTVNFGRGPGDPSQPGRPGQKEVIRRCVP